jgi:eukaryotic-like serine/threonine-protein kinase
MRLTDVGRAMTRTGPAAVGTAPGTEILPGYEVVRLLRRGGRLDTYDVYSHERDSRCVVKVVRDDRAHEAGCVDALLREGTLLRDLAHPHLVRAYEVIEVPRTAVVLETLTGATLAAVIEDSPVIPADAAWLGLHLVSVLSYLHRHRWLHLDVKPSNIVVQGNRAVLIDLSLVGRPGDGRAHGGTDGYLAPEQVRGRGLSPASDVFGLGVTLGESLTDRLPYGEEGEWAGGTSPRAPGRGFRRRLRRAPAPLADLVLACIDPDPARRPGLDDVRTSLRSLVAVDEPDTGGSPR